MGIYAYIYIEFTCNENEILLNKWICFSISSLKGIFLNLENHGD
jgi:hypothetical protein